MRAEDQSEFIAAILNPNLATPEGAVDPSGNLAPKRFNVYRNNVVSSLIEAMEQGFPAVAKLVGENFFREMARIYVRTHPPKNALMIFYGDDLAEFISGFPPAANLHYLPDIARTEYARRQSYYAADSDTQPDGWFNEIAPEALGDLTLNIHPALACIASPFPIYDIYTRVMHDSTHILGAHEQEILITRTAGRINTTLAPTGMTSFTNELRSGNSITQSAQKVLKNNPQADIGNCVAQVLTYTV